MYKPNHKDLYICALNLAQEFDLAPLTACEAKKLYDHLIFIRSANGGKAILECLANRLVTENEVTQFLVSHTFTTILNKNPYPKIDKETTLPPQINELYERAVFGRSTSATESSQN